MTEILKEALVQYLLKTHNIEGIDDEVEKKLYRFLFDFVNEHIIEYILEKFELVKKDVFSIANGQ